MVLFSAITPAQAEGGALTLVDQSCKWYSHTCRAVLAEKCDGAVGRRVISWRNLRQRRTPGSGTLSGLTGRSAASRMGISAIWVDAARKERCSFCPIHESERPHGGESPQVIFSREESKSGLLCFVLCF